MSDLSDSKTTDQLNEEDEFYDATDRLEKLDVNKSNSETQVETSKSEETNKETDSEPKFVPLHEELNSKLKSNLEEKNSDEEDEKEETNVIGSDEDQFFIDENLLKEQEEKLTEDEKTKNLEEALANKQQGNDAFKEAKYIEALESYTKALKICPYSNNKERAVFYSNRAICFFKTKDYERCIKECTTAIDLDPTFLKPLLRRADCYEASDKLDEALEDYKKLAALEPNVVSHKSKCYELEQKVKERNEKLKDEMMGKLKDLGNMVLKPFGLSTSNFEFVQDPNTGSYSVNFKK